MSPAEAQALTVELKRKGWTYREIIAELATRGAVNPRTRRPWARYSVSKWCREASGDGPLIGDQRGYRHPHLKGLSAEERAAHDAEMYKRKLERSRHWRTKNPEWIKAYFEEYNSL